jgi:hypothetical protein
MAIILFLENHGSAETLNFIRQYYRHKEVIFCIEEPCLDRSSEKKMQPSSEPLDKLVIRYQKKQPSISSQGHFDIILQLLEEHYDLTGNQSYCIDSLFKNTDVKDKILETIEKKLEIQKNFVQTTFYLRDKKMAENLVQLQEKYPQKNIVLIVGVLHGGILYHLFQRQLADTRIRFINSTSANLFANIAHWVGASYCFDTNYLPYPGVQFYMHNQDPIRAALIKPDFQHHLQAIKTFQEQYKNLDAALLTFNRMVQAIIELFDISIERKFDPNIKQRTKEEIDKYFTTANIEKFFRSEYSTYGDIDGLVKQYYGDDTIKSLYPKKNRYLPFVIPTAIGVAAGAYWLAKNYYFSNQEKDN